MESPCCGVDGFYVKLHQEQMFQSFSLIKCRRQCHNPAFPLGSGVGWAWALLKHSTGSVPRPVGLQVTRGRPCCLRPWERNRLGTLQARVTSSPPGWKLGLISFPCSWKRAEGTWEPSSLAEIHPSKAVVSRRAPTALPLHVL